MTPTGPLRADVASRDPLWFNDCKHYLDATRAAVRKQLEVLKAFTCKVDDACEDRLAAGPADADGAGEGGLASRPAESSPHEALLRFLPGQLDGARELLRSVAELCACSGEHSLAGRLLSRFVETSGVAESGTAPPSTTGTDSKASRKRTCG